MLTSVDVCFGVCKIGRFGGSSVPLVCVVDVNFLDLFLGWCDEVWRDEFVRSMAVVWC